MIPSLPPYCYDIPSHHIPMGSSRLCPSCYGLLLLLWLPLQCPWGSPASAPMAMVSFYCCGCPSSAHGGSPPMPLLLWPPRVGQQGRFQCWPAIAITAQAQHCRRARVGQEGRFQSWPAIAIPAQAQHPRRPRVGQQGSHSWFSHRAFLAWI